MAQIDKTHPYKSVDPVGKCTNPNNEYGGREVTSMECSFHKNGNCYFKGGCDKKVEDDSND